MFVGLLFTTGKTGHGLSQLDNDRCSVPLVMMIVMMIVMIERTL